MSVLSLQMPNGGTSRRVTETFLRIEVDSTDVNDLVDALVQMLDEPDAHRVGTDRFSKRARERANGAKT